MNDNKDNLPAAAGSHQPCETPVQRDVAHWYRGNGGHASLNAAIDRAIEECRELNYAASLEDIREEMADVAMCLMMAADIAGFDLLLAVREKLYINMERQWTVDDDGCLHHVKGSDPRDAQGERLRPAAGKESDGVSEGVK